MTPGVITVLDFWMDLSRGFLGPGVDIGRPGSNFQAFIGLHAQLHVRVGDPGPGSRGQRRKCQFQVDIKDNLEAIRMGRK